MLSCFSQLLLYICFENDLNLICPEFLEPCIESYFVILFTEKEQILAQHKVYFQDPKSSKGRDGIPFDGVPFIIIGRKQYDCQHGVDRHAGEKKKRLKECC